MLPLAEDKLQRLGAIAADLDAVREIGLVQDPERHLEILRIVFNKQKVNGFGFGHDLAFFSMVK